MGLADRVGALARRGGELERRSWADTWLTDYLMPAVEQFGYGGPGYRLNTSYGGVKIHEVAASLPGYAGALRACPPAFAAQLVRALVISQARFTFRATRTRKVFGTSALGVLEKPWTNATTSELLSRMEWHAGLAGNAYVTNRSPGRLRVLRPDWVAIVYGSQQEPEQAAYALDGEVIGYVYAIGGLADTGAALVPTGGGRMYTLLPDEIAHWSPIPDPEASGIGVSWVTAAVRDIQVDRSATEHKLRFFAAGATPNLVIKGLEAATRQQFLDIVDMLEERHAGVANAYKTLYLTAGADATVVGSNFKDMDLKNIQGASETRISALSRVPASLLGIAEGLAGSSLNAGNFGMARRIFADTWVYPTLQDLSAALAPLVRVPSDAELWFDTADMPLLREDGKDAADIEQIKATTITQYVREGFTAESAIAAVRGQDVSLLVHTGLVSVQLQPPGTTAPPGSGGDEGWRGKGEPPIGGTADQGTEGALRKFNPREPRDPDGKWTLIGAAKKMLGAAAKGKGRPPSAERLEPPPDPRPRGAAPGGHVRDSLKRATTIPKLNSAAAAEAKRVTGRDIEVDFDGSDPGVAREYAEGILRGLERYPDAHLGRIATGNAAEGSMASHEDIDHEHIYATTRELSGGKYEIVLDRGWSGRPADFRQALAKDGERRRMGRGSTTAGPMGLVLHEFGHVVDHTHDGHLEHFAQQMHDRFLAEQGLEPYRGSDELEQKARRAQRRLKIMDEVSTYSVTNNRELGAEAFADVMENGDGAARLSRIITDAFDDVAEPRESP